MASLAQVVQEVQEAVAQEQTARERKIFALLHPGDGLGHRLGAGHVGEPVGTHLPIVETDRLGKIHDSEKYDIHATRVDDLTHRITVVPRHGERKILTVKSKSEALPETHHYDPSMAEINPKSGLPVLKAGLDGWTNTYHADSTIHDEFAYRGMSGKELQASVRRGKILSEDAQFSGEGTYLGHSIAESAMYAKGVDPQDVIGFNQPGYIVRMKRPDPTFDIHDRPGEILHGDSIPLSSVDKVYEVRPYSITEGQYIAHAVLGDGYLEYADWRSEPTILTPHASAAYREMSEAEVTKLLGRELPKKLPKTVPWHPSDSTGPPKVHPSVEGYPRSWQVPVNTESAQNTEKFWNQGRADLGLPQRELNKYVRAGEWDYTEKHTGWEDRFTRQRAQKVADMSQGSVTVDDALLYHDGWASSADSHSSQAIKIAVAEKFGLPGAQESRRKFVKVMDIHNPETAPPIAIKRAQGLENERNRELDFARAYVDAQYAYTQQYLKEHGITHIDVLRGEFYNAEYNPPAKELESIGSEWTRVRKVQLPLTSWSTSMITSNAFARQHSLSEDDRSYTYAARIPAERIFATANTGLGSFRESEVIPIGGIINSYVKQELPSERDMHNAHLDAMEADEY